MAVCIDLETFQESVADVVAEAAARLIRNGRVRDVEPAGGGVQAVVHDGDALFQPWVGVVHGQFTGNCDCRVPGDCDCARPCDCETAEAEAGAPECDCETADEELCAHAVATALLAFKAGAVFSTAVDAPDITLTEPDPGGRGAGIP